MLILTRKKDESIVIANRAGEITATITVTSTESGKAKLGIEAAPDVAVHRSEIYQRIYGGMPTVLQDAEPEGGQEANQYERLPHPATQMKPMPYLIDILDGDSVGRHD